MVKFIADSSCNIDDMSSLSSMNSTPDSHNTGSSDSANIAYISVPMVIYTDEKTYMDDENRDTTDMLDYLAKFKGRSYTSCPNIESWLAAFDGADTIYVVTLTSALSGTYNAAMAAKEQYLLAHPDAKIEIFDSRSTGPEMHLILDKLMELHNKGFSFDEICKKTHEYMKNTRLFFTLASLHNLAENGRVSKVIAATIGVLGISIIATASEEGEIKPIGKCRGEKNQISSILKELEKVSYQGGKVRICHVECADYAQKICDAIREKYENADVCHYPAGSLCSFYAERGGIIMGVETNMV